MFRYGYAYHGNSEQFKSAVPGDAELHNILLVLHAAQTNITACTWPAIKDNELTFHSQSLTERLCYLCTVPKTNVPSTL